MSREASRFASTAHNLGPSPLSYKWNFLRVFTREETKHNIGIIIIIIILHSIKLWKKGKNYICKQNIKLPKVCQADLKVPQFCLIGGILSLAGEGPALLQQRPEGLLLQAGQRSHPLQYRPTHGRHEKKFEHLYNLALPSARPSRH